MVSRGFVFRLAIRITACLLLIPVALAVYLCHFGFPHQITDRAVRAMASEGYSLEMKAARLDITDGIVIENLKLYRRSVVAPPLIEADEVAIGLRLFLTKGQSRLRRIAITHGQIRRGLPSSAPESSHSWANIGTPPLDFHLDLESCSIYDLEISSLSSDVSVNNTQIWLNHIVAEVGIDQQKGPLNGQFSYNRIPGTYRAHIVSACDPAALTQFVLACQLPGIVVHCISTFTFPHMPPRLDVTFSGMIGKDWSLALLGHAKATDFTRYGVEIRRGEGDVVINLCHSNQTVKLTPITVYDSNGWSRVDLTLDLQRNTATFAGASTMNPRSVLSLVTRSTAHLLDALHIGGPASYTASGFLSFTNLNVCDITVKARAESFGYSNVVADSCSFVYNRNGRTSTVTEIEATLFGGNATGNAVVFPDNASTNTRFAVKCAVQKLDLRKLATTFAHLDKAQPGFAGALSADVNIEGQAGPDFLRSIRGTGGFRIRDGNILRLPLFGKLSDMLADTVPGIDYVLRQETADSAFIVSDGKIHTDELRIEGDILSLKSDGGYDLAARTLDFDVELRFLKKKTWVGDMLQTILLPVTKMLRFRLRGSIDQPEWNSVNF